MIPRIAAIPLDKPFLPALARAWLDAARKAGRDPADGLLILPTRRAARAAAAAFLAANGGPLIMPRISTIGAADEVVLGITAGLELPPAIAESERRAILASLILRMGGRDGAPTRLADALLLAEDLALLIDDAAQAEIDLADTLPGIVAPDLAAHWQRTLDFLAIVTRAWPEILAARGAIDPARRLQLLLDAQGEHWEASPPDHPVWLAGLAVATPAVARLARVVAGLPQGLVVLSGFDPALPEVAWAALADFPTHPQAGLFRLLAAMRVDRTEVQPMATQSTTRHPDRASLLQRAFLPSATLDVDESSNRLFRLNAGDEQDEARAIALALRDALETPGQDAALVTPDRGLAQRVSAELMRLGIRAEDSAGEALAQTPPAVLLRLLAAAEASNYAAVPLLSVLKHPLTHVGHSAAECRGFARRIDLLLRAHLPGPGFSALRFTAERNDSPDLVEFISDLQIRLQPLITICAPRAASPSDLMTGLIETAEAITEGLWHAEAGAALSEHLAGQIEALVGLPNVAPGELVPLLDAVLGSARLRRPRARDANPRVAIWGIMEARLQSVDTLVLGGMVEGVFPAEPEPGPWLSRPMRRAAQLPDSAMLIGEVAHDVSTLIASCGTVILSAPKRRGRAPAVPSRFLARIELVMRAAGQALPAHPAADWAALLDRSEAREPRPRPRPCPPVALRPTRYSVSDITTLLADPYAIYARRILRLKPLNPLEAESDSALFGTIVHDALKQITCEPDWALAKDAETRLATAFEQELAGQRLRRALAAFWRVRLLRIASWIVAIERARIEAYRLADVIGVECEGEWLVQPFTVTARADRIERRGDQIALIDYKTGTPPNDNAVESGTAPQLPIEAVIAELGGFSGFAGTVNELSYWKLSGGATEGETRSVLKGDAALIQAAIAAARTEVPNLLAHYADPTTAFLDAPHPGRQTYKSPFAGISRRAEWEDGA